MNKRMALVSIALAFLAGFSVLSSKSIPKAHAASCYAICAHESHGTTGWTGPIRTGANADADATKDAQAHNNANPGHSASSSCY
jgi:ABC-type sugar transport system substrate-binding protein